MKIAVFHNLPAGGAKRTVYEEVKRLSKKHELDLFEFSSTDESFLDVSSFAKKTVRYRFNIESNLPSIFSRLEKDYQNFIKLRLAHKKIAEKINKGNYDVALVHPDKFTQAPPLLKFLKISSIYYCHELLRIAYEPELRFKENVIFFKRRYEEFTRKVRKIIDRENAKAADEILVNSRFTRGNVKKAYGKRATVCYPGVETGVFKPASEKTKNTILFIGEREATVGFNLIQDSLNLIPEKERPGLRIISFSSGKPRLGDKELAEEYSKSTLTFCASHNEPFGLIPLESMACETPVLAIDEGGYRETIVDGKTGFLLERDPKKFARKITYLIEHPEVVKTMGQAGRRHVKKNFTWEAHVECLERCLKKF